MAPFYCTPTWRVTAAAWRDKHSFGIVATQDMTLSPDLERLMYERSGATVTEVEASHALLVSQPKAVADVIKYAALAAAEPAQENIEEDGGRDIPAAAPRSIRRKRRGSPGRRPYVSASLHEATRPPKFELGRPKAAQP